MKNLIIRALSGAIYIALIILSICIGGYVFATFFGILLIMGMREAQKLAWKGKVTKIVRIIDIATGVAMFLGAFAATEYDIDAKYALIFPIALIIARFIAGLYLKEKSPIQSWANSCFTICYVALPLTALELLYNQAGMQITLFMFVCIWLNDTGAYLVGCSFGEHRLFERISPKKSWEGFIGGMTVCIIAGACASSLLGESAALWIPFGIIVSVFSTWGDLVESLIKRTAGVKDSGNIMPGHGGVLDRIDSLLFVAPIILAYLIIVL
ncbi:MAG: phosphatidate cytidylyltransferase [Muribaculaceae bacterium]